MDYTMKTVAEAADIAYETVRYYCKIGLVPNVRRSANGYRVFDERDVAWLQGLHCLRQCGNRAAHLEPVFRRDISADLHRACLLMGWIDPNARAWLLDNAPFNSTRT